MAGAGIGQLIQGLGEVGSAYLSASFSRKERERAQNFLRKFTVQKPGLMVEGLKRAGLNPILAADGGFSGGVSGPGFQSIGAVRPGTSAGEFAQRMADLALTKEQARKTKAEADTATTNALEELDRKDILAVQRHATVLNAREAVASGSAKPSDWGGLPSTTESNQQLQRATATSAKARAALDAAALPGAQVLGSEEAAKFQLFQQGLNSARTAIDAIAGRYR